MTTLPLFQQNQAPPLACFEAVVNLCPKLPEIIRCRKQGEDNHQTERDAAQKMIIGWEIWPGIGIPKISSVMVATCVAIFSLPRSDASIVKPCAEAMLRRPVTANSRPTIITTIQAATTCN